MDTVSRDVRGAAIVVPSFAPGGSFAARATWPPVEEIVEIRVTEGRGARLVHLEGGGAWVVTSVDVLRDPRGRAAGTDTRRARSVPGGGIEARMEALWANGRRIARSMEMAANGDWSSDFSAMLPNGSRVSGRAAKVGPDGRVRFDRRKIGPDGVERWSSEGYTRRRTSSSGVTADTTASAVYPLGGTAKYRQLVRQIDKVLVKQRAISRQVGVTIPNGALGGTGRLPAPGALVGSQEETTGLNGWSGSFSKDRPPTPGTLGPGSRQQVTDHVNVFKDAQGNVWTGIGRSTIDSSKPGQPGGTVIIEHQWEHHGPDGTSSSHSVEVHDHDNGTSSTTTSHVGADGSTTIITTTTDSNGNGQTHVTTTDKNGNVTSDTTTPVGSGSGSGSGSGTGSGSGSGSGSGGTSGGSGGGGTDDDDGGDDDAMGWEGGDEGPPEIMPRHSSSIFEVLADMDLGADPDSDDPIADRIATALRAGGPLPVGDAGDPGYGEGGGRESLPALVLEPADALSFVRVRPPTEDWGEWNDPRVHVGYAARLVDSMVRAPRADQRALARASVVLRGLAALIESVAGR